MTQGSSLPAPSGPRRTVPSVAMVTSLLRARPWVLTAGGVWLVSGALLLLGLAPSFVAVWQAPARGVGLVLVLGVLTTQALSVVVLGVLACSYGSGLARLREGRTNQSVEAALRREARFWAFAACASLAVLGLLGAGVLGGALLLGARP